MLQKGKDMFLINETQKEAVQLKRVLREFPWLWAVRPSWMPGFHRVSVHRISSNMLYQDSSASCLWWAKIDSSGGEGEKVVTITHTEGANVAQVIIGSFGIGSAKVKYLVRHFPGNPSWFEVLRAPRGEDLHNMCCDAAFLATSRI